MLGGKEHDMPKQLSSKVLNEIAVVVSKAAQARVLIRVYAEADAIRLANLNENIALEDIVQAIIERSAGGLGCEVDPDHARDALLGLESPPTVVH
jgi:hypothetical protein